MIRVESIISIDCFHAYARYGNKTVVFFSLRCFREKLSFFKTRVLPSFFFFDCAALLVGS